MDSVTKQLQRTQEHFDYDLREFLVADLFTKLGWNDKTLGIKQTYHVVNIDPTRTWTDEQNSLFIESLLLGLPTNHLVCIEKPTQRGARQYEVVDGSSRLLALKWFVQGDFALTGLTVLSYLNKARFQDLPLTVQRKLMRTSLRVIEFLNLTDSDKKSLMARYNLLNPTNSSQD